MIGVVIDTNVMVSANLKPEGLEAKVVRWAMNRQAQLYVSPAILEEYQRVLSYPEFKFVPEEIADFLSLVRRVAVLVRSTRRLNECRHESDNRFLECAEAARAHYLVTDNSAHFPRRWKNTQVVNSRQLIEVVVARRLRSDL
ncbi:MAG: putative toxin-antitoxin system toxin component, PIN family [Candidatus Liptonbacteria bacterium]|nr:putative toxin-antitoxin system toxin component, PIN family [Candidatus Liptonbacteria bacterium]